MTALSFGGGDWQTPAMGRLELAAGEGQRIVLYSPPDLSEEIDPVALATAVAEDAARLAEDGWRIMTTAAIPLRHAGTAFGNTGSGYATKMALLVVYGSLVPGG